MSPQPFVAVLNGLVGDTLAKAGSTLAISMTLVRDGRPASLAEVAVPRAKVVVLVHGLMAGEGCWRMPDGSTYGSRLAAELGFAALVVRYNSGLAIPDNGSLLAHMLEDVVRGWPVPVEDLVLIGHSMGGLVVRAACEVARQEGLSWLSRVHRAIYLGTPHRGSPMERQGRIVTRALRILPDPWTQVAARVADLRSSGLQDLGDADLRHADRARRSILRLNGREPTVPLLPGMEHHLVASAPANGAASWFDAWLVPFESATAGPSPFVLEGVGHAALAHDEAVYARIRAWLVPVPAPPPAEAPPAAAT